MFCRYNDPEDAREFAFHSKKLVNLNRRGARKLYEELTGDILEKISVLERQESGWVFISMVSLELHTGLYNPLRGRGYLPLPKWISDKKACINTKNVDNKCFLWCILRKLFLKEQNPERVDRDLKAKENVINMRGIEYPVTLKDIDKFEKQNPEIGVNVYSYKEERFYPLRVTEDEKTNHVDLLYIKNKEYTHYALIKNFERLMNRQISKNTKPKYYCKRCLNHRGSEALLEKHKKYCNEKEPVCLEMPKKGTVLKFKNFDRKLRVPFVVYADFECILKPVHEKETGNTTKTQEHIPASFYCIIKCFNDNVCAPIERHYVGEDAPEEFIKTLTEDIRNIYGKYCQNPLPIKIMKEEKARYEREMHCWICNEEFNRENYKVRDHCHFTGKYRGAAHNECNLKARTPNFTPVYLHNLSGYDAHLFIKILGKTKGKIDCISNNEERYISFSKNILVGKNTRNKIRFLNTFKFMASSLDKLSGNLDETQLKILPRFFPKEHLPLVRKKGIFPYDYLDSFERLKETQLPPKEKFYSSLNKEHISDEDYAHALNVWEKFNTKTFKDYLELYNKIDVLLLADVFENFRDVCHKNYDLDPSWYYTAPGLAWDATLKTTRINLELLSDPDMLLMVELGIRGGVSMCSKRYSAANNKYMGKSYDPTKPAIYLLYIDANSLYPWAMSQPLPTHDFKWMSEKELDKWERCPCILEVDLEYPKELHGWHNDFPLAPEKLKVEKVEKLIPNLKDKKNYVIHYQALKTYLSLGLKLTRIHRGIKFKESAWLKPYIDLNINLQKAARNDFEKDFFKLMCNCVFGKTMENLRNRVNIHLVSEANQCKKLIAKQIIDIQQYLMKIWWPYI